MHPEEPTEKLAFQLWWAITWRSLAASVLAVLIFGQLIATIIYLTGGSIESVQWPANIAAFILGIYIAVQVVKHLMTKGFGEYRLAIIKK